MYTFKKNPARFQLENESAQLGSARLGTFIARARSSWKIPARSHHYKLPIAEILCVENVRAFVVCGFLIKMYAEP